MNKLPSRIKPPLYPLFSTQEPHCFVLYLVTVCVGAVLLAAVVVVVVAVGESMAHSSSVFKGKKGNIWSNYQ
jgi:hypothetical protein